jgi:hypothetical protein
MASRTRQSAVAIERKHDWMGNTMRRRTKKKAGIFTALLLLIAAAGLQMPGSGDVRADDVPPSRQVVVVLRALAYDGNLKSRAGDTINIAVMHKKGNSSSEQMADAITQAFNARQSTLVAGLPIMITQIAYSSPDGLKKAIAGSGIDVLYICEGLEDDVDAIKEITRQTRALSVGAKPGYIEKGFSLGVFAMDGKCTILLNLQASRLEGVSFASDLLGLARVIR